MYFRDSGPPILYVFPLWSPTDSFPKNQGSHFICQLSLAPATGWRVCVANKYLLDESTTGSRPPAGSPALVPSVPTRPGFRASTWVQRVGRKTRTEQARQQERVGTAGNGAREPQKSVQGPKTELYFELEVIKMQQMQEKLSSRSSLPKFPLERKGCAWKKVVHRGSP